MFRRDSGAQGLEAFRIYNVDHNVVGFISGLGGLEVLRISTVDDNVSGFV